MFVSGTVVSSIYHQSTNDDDHPEPKACSYSVYEGGAECKSTLAFVSLYAGSTADGGGFSNGFGTQARFAQPFGIALNSLGELFVSEYNGEVIRMINSTGYVTLLAGQYPFAGATGDNVDGTNARFNSPKQVAVDTNLNIYVADSGNHLIRKLTRSGKLVSH